jgi:hypothetical protein
MAASAIAALSSADSRVLSDGLLRAVPERAPGVLTPADVARGAGSDAGPRRPRSRAAARPLRAAGGGPERAASAGDRRSGRLGRGPGAWLVTRAGEPGQARVASVAGIGLGAAAEDKDRPAPAPHVPGPAAVRAEPVTRLLTPRGGGPRCAVSRRALHSLRRDQRSLGPRPPCQGRERRSRWAPAEAAPRVSIRSQAVRPSPDRPSG